VRSGSGGAGSRWIDATVPVEPGMPVWPGDPGVEAERVHDLARGDPYTLTRLALSVHTGTHLDAPAHYVLGGPTVDRFPHELALCRALVVDLHGVRVITADRLRMLRLRRGTCVLFRTDNSARGRRDPRFEGSFVALDLDAARFLVGRGVRLVGVDGPSVGPPTPEGDEVHRALLTAGIWLLEGLELSAVGAGRYDMVCLPLRLRGAEGAPARVLLRRV